ncbi:MAG: FAD-dependent oxidoreductase, partial [Actinomycetia bacterium]|nr:FAD-dependent oxidoreductase [Actinomycetes bacterium]
MKLRADSMKRLTGQSFDVLIVGGGINGAVSAAALAGRGVSVAMIDRGDFASFTSQESSNLVWGGFKYLENYEIPLVVNLSRSRNRLMRAYPSAITELRFWATLDSSSPVSSWLAALGTVGYWGLGQFATKPPKYHRPKAITAEEPIVRVDTAEAAVEYGDAYLKDNDARFVWGFVRSAIDH